MLILDASFLELCTNRLLERHATVQFVPRSLHMEHNEEGMLFENVSFVGRSQALFAERQGPHEWFCLRRFPLSRRYWTLCECRGLLFGLLSGTVLSH